MTAGTCDKRQIQDGLAQQPLHIGSTVFTQRCVVCGVCVRVVSVCCFMCVVCGKHPKKGTKMDNIRGLKHDDNSVVKYRKW